MTLYGVHVSPVLAERLTQDRKLSRRLGNAREGGGTSSEP